MLHLIRQRRTDLKLTGVDFDSEILGLARKKLGTATGAPRLFAASADALPVPAGSVDLATSSLVFHHLASVTKEQVFHEVQRVLKPSGHFLLCDLSAPARPWIVTLVERFGSEPEAIPQLKGELLSLGMKLGAELRTLWTLYGCVSLHSVRFPTPEGSFRFG